jgi:hypothetical protein
MAYQTWRYSVIADTDMPPVIWRTQHLFVSASATVCLLTMRLGTNFTSVGAMALMETSLIQLSNQNSVCSPNREHTEKQFS